MRKLFGTLLLLFFCLSLTASLVFASTNQATPGKPLLVSGTVIGLPVAAGSFLFWLDNRIPSNPAIYGYDTSKQAEFVVSAQPGGKFALASDGKNVVWIKSASPNNPLANPGLQGYDLTSRKEFEILPASTSNQFGELALDNGVLYYQDSTSGHRGLYALTLATHQEQLISSNGQHSVAADGTLAWAEERYRGQYLPSEWSLFVRRQGQTLTLAKANGPFEVALSGDKVVWSALPPSADQKVYLYSFADTQQKLLWGEVGRSPLIQGNRVAWTIPPEGEPGQPSDWSVKILELGLNREETLVKAGLAHVEARAFVGGGAAVALLVNRDSARGQSELYLVETGQRNLDFPVTSTASPPVRAAPAAGISPQNCGQVYKSGFYLYDCQGRYWVSGTQFILPSRGINGSTFWDSNYAFSSTDIDYWLGKASSYLKDQTLRIFVDMPASGPAPTSPATLYDFAVRANNLGMRLGIVLHNDTSWTLTDFRKQWLSDFVSYFQSRNALPLIAYLSADNEINNHCGSVPYDCYDDNPTYVSKANQWVADFTGYVKSLNKAILVTVGITTEKLDGDKLPAVYDFFRTVGTIPTMAASVDFLSPHNYGGGGQGIWTTLRYNLGYPGPIVLEEYGFPTDLRATNDFYSEGPAQCRESPLDPACTNSAPFFTEINALAVRENTYQGYAGESAWMLADSANKDCNSPFDYFTGLFASGSYPLCNGIKGTLTTTSGEPKATGYRVQLQHSFYLADALNTLVVTNPTDTGDVAQSGTLSYALSRASAGQLIILAPRGSNTISVSGKLPPVADGVAIRGSCLNQKPLITIDGRFAGNNPGLVLGKNANLNGVKISGFSGFQIKISGSSNKLSCVVATR